MTVVERRERSGSRDEFPIGMRVLAVDDDPTCLKLLETLLLRCQYHVTITNQAIMALKLLRENKDQFDLVISDVHMPDMDGFKLLELVGLEMDLPVIMLSANGETQAVMKGITHGACDYLLKPVRLEELKNIWQHVIRRKKFDTKDQNNLDSGEDGEKAQYANSEGGQGSLANGASDHSERLSRKRKDQNEDDDDDDDEENLHENEDPSAQKKARVVWSVELHRKFVAAVNQLGIDKAVPKRILDLMNVERLTRENVASHLQKYRLYLKRLSAVANQQANMVAALRGRDPSSYLPMGSYEGYANFNALMGSRPLPARTAFQQSATLPRMNSLTGFGFPGLVPSGTTQLSRTLSSTSNPINDLGKLQSISLPTVQGNQHGTLLQGMPTSLELDRLQQPKALQEANNCLLGGFSGAGVAVGPSTNSFANVTKRPLLLQANQQQTQSGGLNNQPSAGIPSLSSDPFEIGIGDSSNFADLGRCNGNWQSAIPSTKFPSNTMPMGVLFSHTNPPSSNVRDNVPPIVSHLGSSGQDVSPGSASVAPVMDSVIHNDAHSQASSLLMTAGVDGDSKLLNFGGMSNSRFKWEEPKHGHTQNPNLICNSSSNSSLRNVHINDHTIGTQIADCGYSSKKMDMPMISQANFAAPFLAQDSKIEKPAISGQLNYKDGSLLEDIKLQGGFGNGCSLDDLVNAMIKPEYDDMTFADGDIECGDIFSLGACM